MADPRKIWQEADCPHGADWDLYRDELVYAGQMVPCIYCGGEHRAEETVQTYAVTAHDALIVLDLPADAAALATLRAEYESGS
jgi:hypothetical protein